MVRPRVTFFLSYQNCPWDLTYYLSSLWSIVSSLVFFFFLNLFYFTPRAPFPVSTCSYLSTSVPPFYFWQLCNMQHADFLYIFLTFHLLFLWFLSPTCISVNHMHAMPLESRKVCQFLSKQRYSWELPVGIGKWKPGPLKEHRFSLPAESSLYPVM